MLRSAFFGYTLPAAPARDEVTSPKSVGQALAPHPAADQIKAHKQGHESRHPRTSTSTSLYTMAKSFRELVGIPASTASTKDSVLVIIDAQNEYFF